MYHVAVCDDDEALCLQFEKVLNSYLIEKKIEIEIFYSGEKLIKAMEEGQHFDLIFLDIELKMMSGVDVGRKIRNELKNEYVKIIYISAKQHYAMELFQVRPMNFLVKPIDSKSIIDSLQQAMYLSGIDEACFECKCGREHRRIPYGKILYFESENRKILIYTDNGKYEMYGKLQAIEDATPSCFIRIHQSFLVNSTRIKRWKAKEVVVDEFTTLPISQAYRRKVSSFLLSEDGSKK